MRTLRLLPLLPVAAALVLLAAPQRAAAAATQEARIVNFDYGPRKLTVDVGTTVRWTNTSNRPHTATDRGGTFDTKPIQPGQHAQVTFSVPGTYFYFCQVNPAKMNGVVVVRPPATPAKAVRVQAVDPGFTGDTFRFDPARLSVPVGTTLLVANVGGKPHTLTADDGSFDTGVVDPGAEGGRFAGHNASLTLTRPGTFRFHCEVHPEKMKGVVTVEGAGEAAAPAAAGGARQVDVHAADFNFSPNDASVAPGGKVAFSNQGKAPHTLTFDDVTLDTGTVQPGASATLTAPAKPGSYSYHCNVHPAKMQGVLVVLARGIEDPTARGQAQPPPPAAAVVGGGPGSGVTAFGLVAAVLAAFLGGAGLSAFAFRRRAA
ncbi:MAG TPA: cupredoxin domain-containing protein [Actinomycetes bacterium]|nr:cupredoxin domain-containing protein [Actinomycetes bacterium]